MEVLALLILQMAASTRPFGITLLAILHVVQAIISFIVGIALIALAAFLRRGFFSAPRFAHGVASLIGVVFVIVSLLYLGLAWGLWTGKGWAWIVSLILAVIGVIGSVVSLVRGGLVALLVLALDVIILYYLFTPHVRTFFGEYKPATPPTVTQTALPPEPRPTASGRFCLNCGAPVQAGERFCSHCGSPVA